MVKRKIAHAWLLAHVPTQVPPIKPLPSDPIFLIHPHFLLSSISVSFLFTKHIHSRIAMAAISTSPMIDSSLDPSFDVDKLTCEIFSILENKFLFGYDDSKLLQNQTPNKPLAGKVAILSIDGGGATDGILAARSLAHLEASLRHKSGNPNARISDYFDNRRRIFRAPPAGVLRRMFRPAKAEKVFQRAFGEATLKDTLKSMKDVCVATSSDPTVAGGVELRSVDRGTRIMAVDGRIAMNNPTAAAITHVLNNKQEFPFCNSVGDLLVVSLGNGESDSGAGNLSSTASELVRIAGEGASDMVDQAVSMAFGESRATNYVRIQGNAMLGKRHSNGLKDSKQLVGMTEEMLEQKNVESVLFSGKKLVEKTNSEKLQWFAAEIMKEKERRKTSILPTVVLKQASHSPRTSSATTLSSMSSN
ncbi:unnamed protein product, partial [Vitis vinifera]